MNSAPRAVAEARRAVTDSPNMFRDEVADQYTKVSRRATAAVDDLAAKDLGARADAAGAVAARRERSGTNRGFGENGSRDAVLTPFHSLPTCSACALLHMRAFPYALWWMDG